MNSLRSVSISRRLWLILIVAVVMLLTLGVLMLKQIHEDLYQAKAQKTQHVVQTASGILTYYHGLETAGTLTRDAAQKQALTAVRGLRYDQNDYFWINDLTPVMIMHPTNPKLEGQNLSTIRDPDGFALFNEMVAIAKAKGAGMVDYRWPKPGASAPVEKTSYVKLFEPWSWVIGSGVYIDDMQAEFYGQFWKASVIGLAIALVMVALVLLIARSIVRPLQETVNAMANIASGESDLTRSLDTHGHDEVTQQIVDMLDGRLLIQRLHQALLQRLTGQVDDAHARRDLPVALQRVDRRRHGVDQAHVIPGRQVRQFQGVAGDDQRPTVGQGDEQLPDRQVETHRRRGQHALDVVAAVHRSGPVDQRQDVAMGNRHALGFSGGAGGVDHVGQVVRGDAGDRGAMRVGG